MTKPENTMSPELAKLMDEASQKKYPWKVQCPNPIPYNIEGFKAGANWMHSEMAEQMKVAMEALKLQKKLMANLPLTSVQPMDREP